MNHQNLIQLLAELSGMARSVYLISEDESIDTLAAHIEEGLDCLVDELQSELRPKFQALHPCEHQWKQITPHEFMCAKCGEQGE